MKGILLALKAIALTMMLMLAPTTFTAAYASDSIVVDGGNSAGVDVSVAGVVTANRFFDPNNQRSGLVVGAIGTNNVEMWSADQTVVLYQPQLITANKLLKTLKGISMDAAGITFPDGTYQGSAAGASTVTDSYSGHIYAPSEGTYYLDPRAPIGRTITEVYAICGTGGISADIYNSGATVGSLNVSPTGVTASLSNTSLAQGGTLELVTSNYSACYDFRFAVRYTQ